eukprot:m.269470 g.269470  ORF g.269470 m.269470 type:complete len:126 (+) comp40538_c0_seq11:1776-2153(+)
MTMAASLRGNVWTKFACGLENVEERSVNDVSEAVTQEQILVVSNRTHVCWQQLGYALGFSTSQLHLYDHPAKATLDKVHAMLDGWKDSRGCKATLGALLEACGRDSVQKRGAIEADLLEMVATPC